MPEMKCLSDGLTASETHPHPESRRAASKNIWTFKNRPMIRPTTKCSIVNVFDERLLLQKSEPISLFVRVIAPRLFKVPYDSLGPLSRW